MSVAPRGGPLPRVLLLLSLFWLAPPGTAAEAVQVRLETSHGPIVLALDAERVPATVENFLAYVRDGHYDGTVFHRVIDGFMIQGGGYTPEFERRPTRAPVRNEADRARPNARGTVAMARTGDPHSATAQFFINVADNAFLDHRGKTARGWGYCVFGRVVAGMETIDRVRALPTGHGGPFAGDVPRETVHIERAVVIRPPALANH